MRQRVYQLRKKPSAPSQVLNSAGELKTKNPRLVIQGNFIQAIDVAKGGNPNPLPRGEVKGFSRASRKRLIELCTRMGNAVPIFLTLTYGRNFPSDPKIWKRHLQTWFKRLRTRHPGLSAIWRLEPQKRGAPHYHLLIYQENGKAPFIDKHWISKSWSAVLGEYSDEDHLKAGTKVEKLRSSRGAAFYAAKYCAKLPEDDDFPPEWERAGRLWGSHNKAKLPKAKQHEMLLHSELEQKAVIFLMKDIYKRVYIENKTKELVKSGENEDVAHHMAEALAREKLDENEFAFNTCRTYSTGEKFLWELQGKIASLEMILAEKGKRAVNYDQLNQVIDKIASLM